MNRAVKGLIAASLLLAGLAASAAAAIEGVRLRLPAKAPLVLPKLNVEGPLLWLPAKDGLTFAGCTVVWSDSARLLRITVPSGHQARLVLGEPYLFEDLTRTPLTQAPRLQGGTLALVSDDLRSVLERLVNHPPTWETPEQSELASIYSLYRGTVPAEPQLVVKPEPQLVETEGPSYVAAKVLTGAKLKTIVIDAGHGGHDPGASGHDGLKEKFVCLDIALRTKNELKRLAPDLDIILTRDSDEFVTLRERTEIANKSKADLFVSVHNNASANRKSQGTQVFFYDTATSDRAAKDLVSRENEDVNELEVLLTDIAKSLVRDQSIGLASRVQDELRIALGLTHRDLSYAPFYVLARTKMPAVLVEVAFITHREEERLLRNDDWRQKVATSIARGILAYRKPVELKP